MSQSQVERIVGRLATDESFRLHFLEDREAALAELAAEGVELNPCELWALRSMHEEELLRFAAALDPRIQKSDLRRRS